MRMSPNFRHDRTPSFQLESAQPDRLVRMASLVALRAILVLAVLAPGSGLAQSSKASKSHQPTEAPPPGAPEVRPSPLYVQVELDGYELDETEVRVAIARELNRVIVSRMMTGSPSVSIRAVLDKDLTARFTTPDGVELLRVIPAPSRADEVAETSALLIGNLVRNEAPDLLVAEEAVTETESQEEQPATPTEAKPPRNVPPLPHAKLNLSLWTPLSTLENPELKSVSTDLSLCFSDVGAISGAAWSMGVSRSRGEVRGFQGSVVGSLSAGELHGAQVSGLFGQTSSGLRGAAVAGAVHLGRGSGNGFQLAGLLAQHTGPLRGAQVAGLLAIAESAGQLTQVGGLVSIAHGRLEGTQISGLLGLTYGETTWVQIAGLSAIAQGSIHGAQIAGLSNMTALDVQGTQVSGAVNIARKATTQISGGANLADSSNLQIGLVNIGGRVEGLQLGLINAAGELDGASVGLITYNKQGRVQPVFWYSSIHKSSLGLRFYSDPLYAMPTLSSKKKGGTLHYSPGFIFGGRIDLAPAFIDLDAGVTSDASSWSEQATFSQTFRAIGGYQVLPWLGLFAGAGVSLFEFSGQSPPTEDPKAEFSAGIQLL